jgi:hypothetical protein
MFDLRVGPADSPDIAIECVQDTDPDSIRVWKKGPAQGCHRLQTKGDWVVELSKTCNVASVIEKLGGLLATLHADCVFEASSETFEELRQIGVENVLCENVEGEGRVYFLGSSGKSVGNWRAQCQSLNFFGVRKRCADSSRGYISDLDAPVATTRSQPSGIPTEGKRGYGPDVIRQCSDPMSCGGVPENDRLVLAPRSQDAPVGTERKDVDLILVPAGGRTRKKISDQAQHAGQNTKGSEARRR